MKKGIDVSFAQGKINWGHVEKVDFAIIRAGYGRNTDQKDTQFENNYTGCKSNKIPVGVYWYSYADSVEDARREARACIEIIKGKTFEYPVYYDIEENVTLKLGKATVSKIAKAFCDELEKAGYWVGIYASANVLKNYFDESILNRYAVWVAHYGVKKPNYSGQYGMWQYSSDGKINGINSHVDLNECKVDYPNSIKSKGLNGFKKSEIKSNVEIAKEVIKGLWGNGDERKKRLKEAGYDYTAVQKEVNKLL